MKILISQIPDEGLDLEFHGHDFEWSGLTGIDMSVFPHGRIFIERSNKTVFLRGHVDAEMKLVCSRCLELFSFSVSIPIRYTLRPRATNLMYKDIELTPEDLEYGYYEEDVLELERLIEEPVILAIPMKPLCQDDCQGLCPVCGRNRNIDICDCQSVSHRSPFSILKGLLDDHH